MKKSPELKPRGEEESMAVEQFAVSRGSFLHAVETAPSGSFSWVMNARSTHLIAAHGDGIWCLAKQGFTSAQLLGARAMQIPLLWQALGLDQACAQLLGLPWAPCVNLHRNRSAFSGLPPHFGSLGRRCPSLPQGSGEGKAH